MSDISCKELIQIFSKIGGKFEFVHDTKTCTLYPQNVTAKFTNEDKDDISLLLSDYAYSGQFDKYVKFLPESETRNKNIFVENPLYHYQEKNTGGFTIQYKRDKDGYRIPVYESCS